MIRRLICAAVLAACVIATSTHSAAADEKAKITLVYDQVLPNAPGKSIRCVLVEYAPGGRSPAHLHPKSAFVYATVLEGSIRSQVNDGPGEMCLDLEKRRAQFRNSSGREAMNTGAAPSRRFVARRGLAAFRSLLMRREELTAGGDVGLLFIGRGDLLDDDRRLVRAESLRLRSATRPASPDARG